MDVPNHLATTSAPPLMFSLFDLASMDSWVFILALHFSVIFLYWLDQLLILINC
jgi:hypothetical protein